MIKIFALLCIAMEIGKFFSANKQAVTAYSSYRQAKQGKDFHKEAFVQVHGEPFSLAVRLMWLYFGIIYVVFVCALIFTSYWIVPTILIIETIVFNVYCCIKASKTKIKDIESAYEIDSLTSITVLMALVFWM